MRKRNRSNILLRTWIAAVVLYTVVYDISETCPEMLFVNLTWTILSLYIIYSCVHMVIYKGKEGRRNVSPPYNKSDSLKGPPQPRRPQVKPLICIQRCIGENKTGFKLHSHKCSTYCPKTGKSLEIDGLKPLYCPF